MRKGVMDFLVSISLVFTKPYLMLIIYNKFLVESFNIPTINYWQMFFITIFIGMLFGNVNKTLDNVIKSVNKKENEDYSKEYLLASMALVVVFWLNIFILKLFF